ncbi:hypothetical protein KMU_00440 [Proteus vulgaris]|nr:hypothetical protein KMU_00440 [Proteus vulgaris]
MLNNSNTTHEWKNGSIVNGGTDNNDLALNSQVDNEKVCSVTLFSSAIGVDSGYCV